MNRLMPWQPTSILDEMFGEPFRSDWGSRSKKFFSGLDIFVEDNKLFVNLDVPGQSNDTIDVKYNSQTNTIVVKTNSLYEPKNKPEFYTRSRSLSESTTKITIPELDYKLDTFSANVVDGVLTVTVDLRECCSYDEPLEIPILGKSECCGNSQSDCCS
jgi:HSP20 family molecular chaperone IbpA